MPLPVPKSSGPERKEALFREALPRQQEPSRAPFPQLELELELELDNRKGETILPWREGLKESKVPLSSPWAAATVASRRAKSGLISLPVEEKEEPTALPS